MQFAFSNTIFLAIKKNMKMKQNNTHDMREMLLQKLFWKSLQEEFKRNRSELINK